MIDIFATFVFSSLVVFTVFRAIKLDRKIPWFSIGEELLVKKNKDDISAQ